MIGASSAQQPVELADPFLIETNYLAVDDRVLHWQLAESGPQRLEPQAPEIARHQTTLAVVDISQGPEPVVLQLEDVVWVVERLFNEP